MQVEDLSPDVKYSRPAFEPVCINLSLFGQNSKGYYFISVIVALATVNS